MPPKEPTTNGSASTSAETEKTPAGSGDAETSAAETEGRVYTQAEIDRIVRNRLEQERKKQEKQRPTDGDQAELERARRRLQEYEDREAQWERERQEARVIAVLSAAGALHPELLVHTVEFDALDWDDKGNLRNREALTRRLRQQYPELFRSASADGGARGTGPTEPDMNTLIRQRLGRIG